jgi:hypothetical protein
MSVLQGSLGPADLSTINPINPETLYCIDWVVGRLRIDWSRLIADWQIRLLKRTNFCSSYCDGSSQSSAPYFIVISSSVYAAAASFGIVKLRRVHERTEVDGETTDLNTKTALQLEAVEPHTTAIIAKIPTRQNRNSFGFFASGFRTMMMKSAIKRPKPTQSLAVIPSRSLCLFSKTHD